MKYTSAEAAKLLKALNEQHDMLDSKEDQSSTFIAALSEDIESVRPEYDYEATRQQLEEIERKIRTVKHAINVFNTTHKVPGFDMTIDEVLVYMPQLSERKRKLYPMASALPKTRQRGGTQSNIIDYRYTNYDVKKAEADLTATGDLLARLQNALDIVNTTEKMEIEI
ncbi:MAG: hypothetical protein II871_03935 [Clostridia bacterium]|nr:hypothetical protein [Clostridia bacterium]